MGRRGGAGPAARKPQPRARRASEDELEVRLGAPLRWQLTAEEPEAEGEEPPPPELKWIHVASAGTFQGHSNPFTLDEAVFDSFIKNFHANPQYKLGESGHGETKVLPFDYEHASEMMPTEGSIPQFGAVAPAWALELEKRQSPEGELQLWALAKLGSVIQEQIANENYQFVSIAFTDGIDPVTGADVGPMLTSIAFTNHPFLKMLTPIAARDRRRIRALSNWYGDAASSPQQGFEYTRDCLNLPAATSVDEVLGQITRIVSWANTPGTTPPGVDLDQILSDLRKIWGVPITATADEVSQQASQAAAALVTPQGAPGASASEGNQTMGTNAAQTVTIDITKLAAIFTRPGKHTRVLSTRMLAGEADVVAAVDEAVNKSADLGTLLEALGFPNLQDAITAAPDIRAARTKLADALAQLDEMMAGQATQDEAVASSDVAAAVAARNYPKGDDGIVTALTFARTAKIDARLSALPKDANWKQKAQARQDGRRDFLASYGVAENQLSHLLTTIAAGAAGQVNLPSSALRAVPPPTNAHQITPPAGGGTSPDGKKTIDLTAVDGRNPVEKLHNWIRANEPELAKASFTKIDRRAYELRRSKNVEIITTARAS
jgi:hypothetical protein